MEDGCGLGYSQYGHTRDQEYKDLVHKLVAEVFDFVAVAVDCAALLFLSRQL